MSPLQVALVISLLGIAAAGGDVGPDPEQAGADPGEITGTVSRSSFACLLGALVNLGTVVPLIDDFADRVVIVSAAALLVLLFVYGDLFETSPKPAAAVRRPTAFGLVRFEWMLITICTALLNIATFVRLFAIPSAAVL